MGPHPCGCGGIDGVTMLMARPPSFNGAASMRMRRVVDNLFRILKSLASMGPHPCGCGGFEDLRGR